MSIFYWELIGVIFTILFGSVNHFLYKWSGKKKIVGLISPVNESTWEHMKLITTPMILFSLVEYVACGYQVEN